MYVAPDTFLSQTMGCGKLKKRAWIDLGWHEITYLERIQDVISSLGLRTPTSEHPALPLISWWLYSGHLTSGSFAYPIYKMKLIRPFSQFVMSSEWKKASRPFPGVPASWWDPVTRPPTQGQDMSVLVTRTHSALSAWQSCISGICTVLSKYILLKCMSDSCAFSSQHTSQGGFRNHMSQ